MTREEFKTIVATIKTMYPRENQTFIPSQEAFNIWYDMMKDLEYRILQMAVKQYIQTPGNKFAPSVGDLRGLCAKISAGDTDEKGFDTVLEEIHRKIHSFGQYREEEALASMTPIARETAEAFGWRRLCLFDGEIGTMNAQLREIYNLKNSRKSRNDALTPELKAARQRISDDLSRQLMIEQPAQRHSQMAIDQLAQKLAIEDKREEYKPAPENVRRRLENWEGYTE